MARRPQALHQPEDEVLIALYEPPRPGDSGSAFGCKPTPAIQLAGSTSAYKRVPNDMGINAGRIVASTASVEQVGWSIFERLITVAGSEHTKTNQINHERAAHLHRPNRAALRPCRAGCPRRNRPAHPEPAR